MKKLFFLFLLSIFILGNIFADQGHSITDKAELKKVAMELKAIDAKSKEKIVLFSLTLKNTTQTPLVYKATAIIDNKSAGEGIIPSDEQGLKKVMPGEEFTGQVSVMYDKMPTNFILIVDVER